MRTKVEEQVSWNLSQEISSQIASLIRLSRTAIMNGNVLRCYFLCKELRLLINHHLKEKEVNTSNVLERLINDTSLKIKALGFIEEDDEYEFDENADINNNKIKLELTILNNRRFLLVEKYRRLLHKLLDSYGYMMERKSDASTMF